jgi:hypothetical protein
MDGVIVVLGNGIADKLIESGALAIAHGLHQLGTETSLETNDLLSIRVHKLSCISG